MAITHALRSYHVQTSQSEKYKVSVRFHNSGNQYALSDSKKIWIRNFGVLHANPLDINSLYSEDEIKIIINNELVNNYHKNSSYEPENLADKNVFIVSDGYGFEKSFEMINSLEIKNSYIILTNNSLKLWEIKKYLPSLFVVNNPYKDCLANINKKIFPRLLASSKTYPEFFKNYNFKAGLYIYHSTPQINYQAPVKNDYSNYIDDYRNPICAALINCFYGNAKKIYLMSCSDGYKEERHGSYLVNNVYQYPQQTLADEIINLNIFWYLANKPQTTIKYFGINKSFCFAQYIDQEQFEEEFK
jgi:hypothetical protein